MSRQNFVSSDFFVTTSEKDAKKVLCSLAEHLPHVTLLKENTLVHSTRFLFEDVERKTQYYVDVSIMSLNDQYVRFNLHVSYTNGQAFNSDTEISNVLYQFEQSVHATLRDDFGSLHLVERKPVSKKSSSFVNTFLSLVLSKYHY